MSYRHDGNASPKAQISGGQSRIFANALSSLRQGYDPPRDNAFHLSCFGVGSFDRPDRTMAIETRSLPTLARRYPRGFTFCVARPLRSAEVNRRYLCRFDSQNSERKLTVPASSAAASTGRSGRLPGWK
jgi:hypothetical protein